MAKVGDKLGKWTLRRPIGEGGQGQVFAATSDEATAEVAIKVVKATRPKKRARFLQEIAVHQALSAQGAPNIMPLIANNLEELQDGGVHGHIVMPLAQSTLDDHRDLLIGRLDLCLEIFAGVVRGVQAAHKSNTVHRDIKPRNILFLDQTLRTPLISDFGICLLKETPEEDRLTEVGETVGARFFMAPEQERGGVADIQPNADIYALGKLLHYMVTGRFLHREALDEAFTSEEIKSDKRYSEILSRILSRTIVFQPPNRIQTADELLNIVEEIRSPRSDGGGNGGARGDGGSPSSGGTPSHNQPAEVEHLVPASSMNALPEVSAFNAYVRSMIRGETKVISLEFDQLRRDFVGAWTQIHESIRGNPKAGASAARTLIENQWKATAAMLAIARADANASFADAKKLIELIMRASEGQSGYPAVFTAPHAQAGYHYMGMSLVALQYESWDVLHRLLTDKFEWYYQSGRPNFSYGYALSYFFHIDALGRGASTAHDLYREILNKDPVVAELGLVGDELLNAYLRVQFLMSLRGAQALEKGEQIALWPDFGRFHGYRVEPILDRMYHDNDYGKNILRSFGESKTEFFSKINGRIRLLAGRMKGDRFFWDSIDSWEPR